MKKFLKKNKYAVIAVCLSLVFLAGAVKASDSGFWDRVALYAGQVLGSNLADKIDVSEGVILGGMPGSELPGPDFTVAGVKEYNYSGSFAKATTTLFSIKSPSSTSSLIFLSMQDTTGTGTAATWVVASSTSRWATTTASNITSTVFTVAASAQESFVWTPLGGSVRDMIIPPNTWILGKTEGEGLGGYTYVGTYRLKLIELK